MRLSKAASPIWQILCCSAQVTSMCRFGLALDHQGSPSSANLAGHPHPGQHQSHAHHGKQNSQHVTGKPARTEKNIAIWGKIREKRYRQPRAKQLPCTVDHRPHYLGTRFSVNCRRREFDCPKNIGIHPIFPQKFPHQACSQSSVGH